MLDHIKHQPFLNVTIQIKLTMMARSSQSTAADLVRPSNNRVFLLLALKWRLFCDEEPIELGARPWPTKERPMFLSPKLLDEMGFQTVMALDIISTVRRSQAPQCHHYDLPESPRAHKGPGPRTSPIPDLLPSEPAFTTP
ncbi:hypothetical protein Q8A67_000961 [Cirrhinus molitorella]|uniref:Uncharacterized protein n=1 Tax=Cirrhinus molitorella TaxID=172907 RepID=A0AA88Q8F0_9TELE|nr:hypothetical protein Q8A67_000961 [Cirrhinus molitorella]